MRTPTRRPFIARNDRAFTLVELLVVIAIIALLISLTVVVAGRAFGTANKTRLGYQLQTIGHALEAYKADFNALPITNLDVTQAGNLVINATRYRGARTLCKALMGPAPQQSGTGAFDSTRANQDGADNFGFRVPPRSGVFRTSGTNAPSGNAELAGKVYGPYLAPDQFKVANLDPAKGIDRTNKTYDDRCVILDAVGNPILYYAVLNPQPAFAVPKAFIWGDTGGVGLPMYRYDDNDYLTATDTTIDPQDGRPGLTAQDFQTILGDIDHDGAIGKGETAAVKNTYILWSAGPDGFFGFHDPKKPTETDDVTTFQQP